MGDKEAIGVIIDDLIDVLESIPIYEFEEDEREFGVNLLLYLSKLCYDEGMDLDMVHKFKID